MVSKTLALLTLSVSFAVARPQRHSHFHHSGSGMRGTGWAHPTDGSSEFNSTFDGGIYPTGSAAVASATDGASSADLSIYATPTEAVAAADTTTSCTTYSTTTEYATSVYYLTVTAGNADISLSSSSATAVAAGAFYGGHSNDGNNGYTARSSSTTFAVVTTKAASTTPIAYTTAPAATSAAASVSSAAPAASSSSSSSGGSSSAKKGLSYDTTSMLSLFSGSGASWAYNWGLSDGGSVPSGVEYVPMCWGSAAAAGCASSITSSGASHMLSFNEPDLGAQSNLDPATAAKLHIQYVAGPLAGKVKIGSPAITSSENSGQGLSWMKTFLDDCGSSCKIDFMAIHWYGDTTQLSMFQSHVGQAVALASSYGISKIWITEFAATGAVADQATFLEKACSWLDTQSAVERYAYFMAGTASGGLGMVTGTTLNAVGLAYDA